MMDEDFGVLMMSNSLTNNVVGNAADIERRVRAIQSLRPDLGVDQLLTWAKERSQASITHCVMDYLDTLERAAAAGQAMPWESPVVKDQYRLSEWIASNLRQS